MLNYRQTNHLLTVLALLSCFSFAGIGDKENQWFWLSMRIMGAGCAVSAVYGYSQEEKDAELNNESTRLLDAVGDVKQGHDWEKYQLALTHAKEIESFEGAIAQLHQQLEGSEQSVFEQTEAANERLALEYHRLQQEREQHVQEKALLDEHWDTQQQSLEAQQQSLQAREETYETAILEEYRSRIEALQEKELALELQEKQMLEGFEREWTEREGFYSQIADAAIQETYSLKQPDYPQGHTHEELLASEAVKCLYEHGIVVKQPQVNPLPNGRFELCFKICPVLADGKTASPTRSLTEAYKRIERELIKPLRLAVRSCCADPVVEPIHLGIKLTFDISGTDWNAIEQERKVQLEAVHDPDPSHLFSLVSASPHLCLMGDSGEGKTTLINNLLTLMQQELGSGVTLIGVNPKPDEDTDLTLLKYSTFETAIFGLLEAIAEIIHRLHLKDEAVQQRRTNPAHPFPDHQPVIYFFDEFSELSGFWNRCKPAVLAATLDEFEQTLPGDRRAVMELIRLRVSPATFVSDLLKFGLRIGRSEKVKILIAGQNLKASVLGTTIQDLQQLPFIYLGAAIEEGLQNRIPDWQKPPLVQEREFRSRLVAGGKANPFYGLFVPKGSKEAYFATLPHPQQFDSAPIESSAATGDEPSAPTDPEAVQSLERLLQLPHNDRTHNDRTRTSAVQGQFDPLDSEISRQLTDLVLQYWDAYQSQIKVIDMVWNAPKSGTSKQYRAAKWKLRRILNKHNRALPGKPWGEDPDDTKNFNEVSN